jgi:hypothetical protein
LLEVVGLEVVEVEEELEDYFMFLLLGYLKVLDILLL